MALFFTFLGKIVSRTWYVWLICWVVGFGLLWWNAPPWRSVAEDEEFAFLPADAPGRAGDKILKQAFPDQPAASNVVFVIYRVDRKLDGPDWNFVNNTLKPALEHIATDKGLADANAARPSKRQAAEHSRQHPTISAIRTASDLGSGALLISQDKKATLVIVELNADFMELANRETLEKLEAVLEKARSENQVPAGLQIQLSGSATAGRDINVAQLKSASATEVWTIVFVVGLLLLLYRAPLLAVVPLLTVFVALQTSVIVLSLCAEQGLIRLFEGIQIYITIILYGAGVDYCLFLIARYREELESGQTAPAALASTISKVGGSITASAATVMFGIGMMASADFGKFHYAGLAIAISLAIGLVAVMTLATSLLCLAGRWAFWPIMPETGRVPGTSGARTEPKRHVIWEKVASILVRWPGAIWLLSVLGLSPFVIVAFLYAAHVNYDLLQRLPADSPAVLGTRALQEHFSAGAAGPVTMLLVTPDRDLRTDESQQLLKQLIDRLRAIRHELSLTNILSVVTPIGITGAGKVGDVDLSLPFDPAGVRLEPGGGLLGGGLGLGGGLDLGENYHKQNFMRQKALEHYVSHAGDYANHVTQFQFLVDMNPLSREGAGRLTELEKRIKQEMPPALSAGSKIYFVGSTSDIRDLIAVTGADETRIRYLVTGCVFLILLFLLRRPVVAMYLIVSVLFSFFATLGATYAFFWAIAPDGFPGLDWKVSVLLFTVLVAIGEDYNIFLMTRVDEEERTGKSSENAVVQALVKTGPIITSCGLIMAGTFGTLVTGKLADLQQLGFALALGVLLDTFLVRPVLVPAFLILFERLRGRRTAAA